MILQIERMLLLIITFFIVAFICDSFFLQELFEVINYHLTQTTEHQPTGNPHIPPQSCLLRSCNISFHHIGENTRYLEVLVSQMTNCFVCDAQTALHISKSFSTKLLCILFQLPSNFNLVEHFQSDNKLLVQRAKWNSSFFQVLSDVHSDKEQLFP